LNDFTISSLFNIWKSKFLSGPEGAYSISLSGGYEDDIDLGECFTYTGEGGRALKGTASDPKNLRTAPQSKDQTLTRGNLALSLNITTRKPVRVIRGSNLKNEFAPEYGYRYDGNNLTLKIVWNFKFIHLFIEVSTRLKSIGNA
jgi:hypothetical protein